MRETALITANMPPIELIRNARLPEIYQNAKLAISECARVDECQSWANKFEALASYARQAGEQELRKMADRIQARAIRRCGELLKEIESQRGKRNQYTALSDGNGIKQSRSEAAEDAGLSKRQAVTAIRVSNIPEEEFHEAVESENPPTVTALAERRKQSRPKPIVDLEGIEPTDYQEGTRLLGLVSNFRRQAASLDLDTALRGMKSLERKDLINDAAFCLE